MLTLYGEQWEITVGSWAGMRLDEECLKTGYVVNSLETGLKQRQIKGGKYFYLD